DRLRVSYTLDNRHPVIGLQTASIEVTEATFVDEIAPARTYGFLKDVPMMRQNGLARGGSLDNPLVVRKPLPPNHTPRLPDEFVRHKVLDLIGDLAVLGRPVVGHVVARNAGHALNHELVTAIQQACAAERRRAVNRVRVNGTARRAVETTGRQEPLTGLAAL